jgi:hypothetical protein
VDELLEQGRSQASLIRAELLGTGVSGGREAASSRRGSFRNNGSDATCRPHSQPRWPHHWAIANPQPASARTEKLAHNGKWSEMRQLNSTFEREF